MPEKSYTTSLFKAGVPRMAQKVGEEAVETVIEAVKGDDERMIYEASDLVYHASRAFGQQRLRHHRPGKGTGEET